MQRISMAIICGVLIAVSVPVAGAKSAAVPASEAKEWAQYTVPLPKSMEITASIMVPKGEIAIVAPAGSDIVIDQACKELREMVGMTDQSVSPKSAFTITLQLGGPEAEKLKSLKYSYQAYTIFPESGDKGLRLVALNRSGLYYAVQTLRQLVSAYSSNTDLKIPLVTITDWPDMEDRGTWGSDNVDHLQWFGHRKLNIVEQIYARSVTADGRGHSWPKPGREVMNTEGPKYAIKAVPAVLHLELVSESGLFEFYPNLKAKGGERGCICYSQPQFVGVLADWICELISMPNVYGVDVWMAENLHQKGGCQCEQCSKEDRNILEIRTIIAAWRKAEERLGRKIPLYVLSSEETYRSTAKILKELPLEIGYWYYNWVTYNSSERPMIPPVLERAAAEGKWIGVVPNLDSMTHFCEPFTGADFIHYRMSEFINKGLKGLLAYVTPFANYYYFNLEAAAEWTWNLNGRTPQEFALSYAVRQKIKNPVKWAEWAGLVGAVEWDVYGSDWTVGARRGIPDPVAKSLLEGKLPELGFTLWDAFSMPFGDIENEKQLNDDVAIAAKALQIAREMGIPEYWYESLVADGYIKSLKALWELRGLVKSGKVAEADRENAEKYFKMYYDGLKQVADAIPRWEDTKDTKKLGAGSTFRVADMCNKLRDEMAVTATKLGFDIKL